MRMRMNNEDDISREARLRKEARELEAKGIIPKKELPEEVVDETIITEEEELVEETPTVSESVQTVSKRLPRKKEVKKKAKRK